MSNLKPKEITKPMQLIAFLCIAVTGEFITAAKIIDKPEGISVAFGIAAIVSGLSILLGFFIVLVLFRENLMGDKEFTEYRQNTFTDKKESKKLEINESLIYLNDLLPDYELIRESLIKNGFQISSTFGSTSKKPKIPEKTYLVFGTSIKLSELKRIVKILEVHTPLYLKYSPSTADFKKIYIGAYANDMKKSSEVTYDFIKKLDKTKTVNELISTLN